MLEQKLCFLNLRENREEKRESIEAMCWFPSCFSLSLSLSLSLSHSLIFVLDARAAQEDGDFAYLQLSGRMSRIRDHIYAMMRSDMVLKGTNE